jgi:hypothetical protein
MKKRYLITTALVTAGIIFLFAACSQETTKTAMDAANTETSTVSDNVAETKPDTQKEKKTEADAAGAQTMEGADAPESGKSGNGGSQTTTLPVQAAPAAPMPAPAPTPASPVQTAPPAPAPTPAPPPVPEPKPSTPLIGADALVAYAMEYGQSVGMRWEGSLTKDNCSWEAPGHLSSLQTDDARTAAVRSGLARVKKLQSDTGYTDGEYAYRVYFEDIGSGDFKIYFLMG